MPRVSGRSVVNVRRVNRVSVHKEALEEAIKVFEGKKDSRAVAVIEDCLETARQRVKDYQKEIKKELEKC